jgi:hypothetical protein
MWQKCLFTAVWDVWRFNNINCEWEKKFLGYVLGNLLVLVKSENLTWYVYVRPPIRNGTPLLAVNMSCFIAVPTTRSRTTKSISETPIFVYGIRYMKCFGIPFSWDWMKMISKAYFCLSQDNLKLSWVNKAVSDRKTSFVTELITLKLAFIKSWG